MKKRIFKRTLATLLALVLSVTLTCSNFTVAKADTTVSSEKELMQCSDNWVIFRYMDENNTPQFDVTYDGKTVDEWVMERSRFEYNIILKGLNYDNVTSIRHSFYGTVSMDSSFKKYPTEDIYVQFVLVKSNERILSDCFPLYGEAKLLDIRSLNTGYLEVYNISDGNPNNLTLQVKVGEHLKKSGEVSVSSAVARSNNFDLTNVTASNISFKNHTENYTIDGQNYSLEYAVVTFNLRVLDTYYYDPSQGPIDDALITYLFTINGLVGVNTNRKIETFDFSVLTPAFPESEKPVVEPTTTLVKSIKILSASNSVVAGKTLKLSCSVNADATNKSVVWSSSNTKYATVDQSGKVTTKAAGAGKTVTITAKAKDGSGKLATFQLKIAKIHVTKIKLKAKKSVKAGKKVTVKATVTPKNATNAKVTWSVNKKKYAKINSKGVLTAKKAGKGKTVTVTAKAKDGSGKKATIKIKIKK